MARSGTVLAALFLAAFPPCVSADPPPPAPETVRALRYRVFTAESVTDFNHGGGYWIEELWFPDRKVCANVTTIWSRGGDEVTVHAFFAEKMRNWSQTRGLETEREQPTEEVLVPRALAERIVALAEATRRAEEERKALGPVLVAARVLRTRTGDAESRASADPTPTSDVGASAAAREFLATWAEPEGGDVDALTHFPMRVKRVKDQGVMVLVPRGPFHLGSEARIDEAKGSYLQGPSREAELTKAYYMDVDEVSVAQWRRYARATGGAFPALEAFSAENEPIRNMTYAEAAAFARWSGCSLPTEGQWERAARAEVRYGLFPNDAYHDHVERRNGRETEDGFAGAAPVGSFPANGWGLRDLSGNVAEWCADWFAPLPEDTAKGDTATVLVDPAGPREATERVVKGGSFRMTGNDLSIGHRESMRPDARRDDVGFRCVRALP